MAETTNKEAATIKKTNRANIEKKLEEALAEFKDILGEKKFKRRIKKAVKAFAHGIEKGAAKPGVKVKKASVAPKPKKAAKQAKAPRRIKASK